MDAIKALKIDLISVRPYFTIKNLTILVGLGAFYGILSKSLVMVLATVQMFAIFFSGFPFLVGEESGIDPLYKLFGIDSKDVVRGRYLLATLFVGVMLIIGMILALITTLIFPITDAYQILLLTAPVIGLVALFIIFIEYPIYFKYGYKKGKTLATIPFLLIAVGAVGSAFFGNQLKMIVQLFIMNKLMGIIAALAAFAIVLYVSFKLSNKLYSRRDF